LEGGDDFADDGGLVHKQARKETRPDAPVQLCGALQIAPPFRDLESSRRRGSGD
jgi:hypothetical protein